MFSNIHNQEFDKKSELSINQSILNSKVTFSYFMTYSYAEVEMKPGRVNYSSPELANMVPSNNCGCLAFRFDDVQNGWLENVQLEVISKFREKNIPLTIGILGNELRGYMATHVSQIANEDNSKIELANHGWFHEDFTTLDKGIQSQLMEKTNMRIFNVTGKSPKIFIPPFNVFNDNTITAMKENNFTHFSSSVVYSKLPYPLVDSPLYNFPETSTTGTITPGLNLFEGLPHTETMKDILASQKNFGFSVVTLHPQEYSIIQNGAYTNQLNMDQMKELDLLIDEIQKSNLKMVFLSKISEKVIETQNSISPELPIDSTQNQDYLQSPNLNSIPKHNIIKKIPDWVKNNAGWWADDMIEDSGFAQGIQYLIIERIITIPETTHGETSRSSDGIPSWVKNNARWWVDGQITDNDFFKGIQYLVEQGIIRV